MDKKLRKIETDIDDLYIIEPNIYKDNRGEFLRVFCEDELTELFSQEKIRQINHSVTNKKGSTRGLHFQYMPDNEIKIVKCIKGRVLDIVVDVRKNSTTFLKSFTVELSSKDKNMIYIPKGFAHGFQTLEDDCELVYFHSGIYVPNNEGVINIKDPILDIKLPLDIMDISKRDAEAPFINKKFEGIDI